jgi:hypothetical protein
MKRKSLKYWDLKKKVCLLEEKGTDRWIAVNHATTMDKAHSLPLTRVLV